jgi:hypothetical protein
MTPGEVGKLILECKRTGYLPDGSRSCILCGDHCPDEPMFTGVWIPFGKQLQRRLGCSEERLANGGGRVILYMVCPTCFERPTRNEDVEREILKRGVQ